MRCHPWVLTSLLVLVFLSGGSAISAQVATLVADYQFNNTLSSGVFDVPGLVNNGSSGTNTFITDTVDGQSRTVLQFPNGNGVNLSPTTGVLPDGSYSIVLLFRFDAITSYRKIIDFKNRSTDLGFYNLHGSLQFYNVTSFTTADIAPNTYVQIVLTRDSGGSTTGYVNGVQRFNFQDTANNALPNANTILHFFQDDFGGESSAGAVARIRIYDNALSSGEVSGLDRLPTIQTVLRGDVAGAGDGQISVLDIIALTRILLGKNATPSSGSDDYIRADANADNTLDIADIIELVRVILRLPAARPIAGETAPVLALGQTLRHSSGQVALPIVLTSDTPLAGLQLSVALPTNGTLFGPPTLASGLTGFFIDSLMEGATLRIIIYSPTLQTLPRGTGAVVYLPLLAGKSGDLTQHVHLIDAVSATLQAGRLPVIVQSAVPPSAPDGFTLGSAYPNPANPGTTIAYDVPQQGHLTLSIFNLLGQEIIRLVDGVKGIVPILVEKGKAPRYIRYEHFSR